MISVVFKDGNFFKDIQQSFNPRSYESSLSDAIREVAEFAVKEIAAEAPVRTGKLQRSMRVRRVNKFQYDITEHYYGEHVREGTSTPIFPTTKKVLKFRGGEKGFGEVIYRSFVRGQAPNDYATRAIDRIDNDINNIASSHGFKTFVR